MKIAGRTAIAIALIALLALAASAQTPDAAAQRILNHEKFKAAQAFIDKEERLQRCSDHKDQ